MQSLRIKSMTNAIYRMHYYLKSNALLSILTYVLQLLTNLAYRRTFSHLFCDQYILCMTKTELFQPIIKCIDFGDCVHFDMILGLRGLE